MRVYLCRHGEAVAQAPTDAERPLTERGRHDHEDIEARLRDTSIRVEETIDLE